MFEAIASCRTETVKPQNKSISIFIPIFASLPRSLIFKLSVSFVAKP